MIVDLLSECFNGANAPRTTTILPTALTSTAYRRQYSTLAKAALQCAAMFNSHPRGFLQILAVTIVAAMTPAAGLKAYTTARRSTPFAFQDRGAAPSSASSAAGSEKCSALLNAKGLPNATAAITSATLNGPSGPPAGAESDRRADASASRTLRGAGTLNERPGANGQEYAIHFHLRLPTVWNGRFFFEGGGGSNGNLGAALGVLQGQQPTVALALGYAVVSQDSGHDNRTNNDPARGGTTTFGLDPQARIDFGYNSYQQVTLTAKALIAAYYGRAPQKSYYVGCSEGGREGMMVSQRFPESFDGVLACAPGFRLPRAAVAEAWDSQAFASVARGANLVDANGQPLLNKTFSDEDLALVSSAVLSACDALDGAADGMVQSFTACTTAVVEPKLLAMMCTGEKTALCLMETQIAALKKVFRGASTSAGVQIYSGWAWDAGIGGKVGAAYNQGWRSWKLGAYAAPTNSAINLTLGASASAEIFVTPPVPTAIDWRRSARVFICLRDGWDVSSVV